MFLPWPTVGSRPSHILAVRRAAVFPSFPSHLEYTSSPQNTSKLACTPTQPAPLPLSRIHRLLRPLRSSLNAFNTSLAAAQARTSAEQAAVAAKAASASAGPRVRVGERDGEWKADGSSNNSSPFGGAQGRKKKARKEGATYGNRRVAKKPAAALVKTASTAAPGDLKSMLVDAGVSEPAVLARAQGLLRAWTNVLEGVYGARNPKGKGKARDLPVRERDPSKVRSLVEMMAMEVGWGIEDAVQSCIGAGEAAEPSTTRRTSFGDLDEDDGEGDSSAESIRVKGSLEDGQEDGNLLVDEWYEACPEYCSRWILGQHATAIVVEGLHDAPYALVELLYEACITQDATTEAERFYDLLNYLAFTSFSPDLTSHALAVRSSILCQSLAFFDSLHSTLLSSSFSERLFYSEYLSLTRARLAPGDEHLVAGLCEVICQVGAEMLASIAMAEEGGERGTARMSLDVVERIEREVGFAVPFLLEDADERPLGKVAALERVADAVFDLLRQGSTFLQPLAPISVLLELELHARRLEATAPSDLSSRLPHLLYLDDLQPSSESPSLNSHLAHLTTPRTSYALSLLSASLSLLSLHALDALLLAHTVEAYHTLPDVKATQGRGIVLEKAAFFERLREAEGRCLLGTPTAEKVGANDRGHEHGEKGWRYEDMVASYVPVTPAVLRTGKVDSPLSLSSLGRQAGGSAGKEGRQRTPAKPMFALRGRLRPRAAGVGRERQASGQMRRQETSTSDLEDEEEDGEDVDEDDDTPGRPSRRTARPLVMLDLSMDPSDSETATTGSDGNVLVLDSDSDDDSTSLSDQDDGDDDEADSTALEDDLRYEILERAPSPFPTSEVDDLDMLAFKGRKRSGSEATLRAAGGGGGLSPRKRRVQLVKFAVEESEESEDELGM